MNKVPASPRLLSYLGLAARAGRALSGAEACEIAIRKGTVRMVLLSGDASENTVKHFSDMAAYRSIPCYHIDASAGKAVGHPERKTVVITDEGFAEAVMKELEVIV